jgi:hypothetical protein
MGFASFDMPTEFTNSKSWRVMCAFMHVQYYCDNVYMKPKLMRNFIEIVYGGNDRDWCGEIWFEDVLEPGSPIRFQDFGRYRNPPGQARVSKIH